WESKIFSKPQALAFWVLCGVFAKQTSPHVLGDDDDDDMDMPMMLTYILLSMAWVHYSLAAKRRGFLINLSVCTQLLTQTRYGEIWVDDASPLCCLCITLLIKQQQKRLHDSSVFSFVNELIVAYSPYVLEDMTILDDYFIYAFYLQIF
ncbi:hypothetical protein ACJX0J_008486, partial [Zea mays]